MANSYDRDWLRRSLSDVASQVGAVTAPLRRSLAVSLSALRDGAQAAFTRYLDHGYDPGGAGERGGQGVAVRDLSMRYGEVHAFEGLTGEFVPGSLTAVVGPNGAGKNSLLKVLAGMVRPSSGEVVCPALARRRLAYLPQQAKLDRDFPISVAKLVALGDWRNFGAVREPSPQLAARVDEAVGAVGLMTVIDRPIAKLSVGQFQRALFARLLPLAARPASFKRARASCAALWDGSTPPGGPLRYPAAAVFQPCSGPSQDDTWCGRHIRMADEPGSAHRRRPAARGA